MTALLLPSSSSICSAIGVYYAFLTHVLLFLWCDNGVLVLCSRIRALAPCGICLESLYLSLSLLQIYN
jgi:hypothetical protein